jgi:carbon-monoxide dehydrogenase small subunit
MMELTFILNGKEINLQVAPDSFLIDILREKLGLTGTKKGCGKGDCGACSVLIDGKLANSCLVMAVQVQGKEVLTIEGLASGDKLHPIQEAFINAGAIQCGYCTPGMVLAAKAILDENPNPDEEEIKTGLSGNLCRCTGYSKIVKAVEMAREQLNSY